MAVCKQTLWHSSQASIHCCMYLLIPAEYSMMFSPKDWLTKHSATPSDCTDAGWLIQYRRKQSAEKRFSVRSKSGLLRLFAWINAWHEATRRVSCGDRFGGLGCRFLALGFFSLVFASHNAFSLKIANCYFASYWRLR